MTDDGTVKDIDLEFSGPARHEVELSRDSLMHQAVIGLLLGVGFAVGSSLVVVLEAPWFLFSPPRFLAALPRTLVLGILVVLALGATEYLCAHLQRIESVEERVWRGGAMVFLISSFGLGAPFGFPGRADYRAAGGREVTERMAAYMTLSKVAGVLAFAVVLSFVTTLLGGGGVGMLGASMVLMVCLYLSIPSRHLEGYRIWRFNRGLSVSTCAILGVLFYSWEFGFVSPTLLLLIGLCGVGGLSALVWLQTRVRFEQEMLQELLWEELTDIEQMFEELEVREEDIFLEPLDEAPDLVGLLRFEAEEAGPTDLAAVAPSFGDLDDRTTFRRIYELEARGMAVLTPEEKMELLRLYILVGDESPRLVGEGILTSSCRRCGEAVGVEEELCGSCGLGYPSPELWNRHVEESLRQRALTVQARRRTRGEKVEALRAELESLKDEDIDPLVRRIRTKRLRSELSRLRRIPPGPP